MTLIPDTMNALGMNVFDDAKMRKTLDDTVYKKFQDAVASGNALDKATRDTVARTIADWAMGVGAVQFSHFFSPIRGSVPGMKMDAFLNVDFAAEDYTKPLPAVAGDFSGNQLLFAETDGSSFPNGGTRVTHTAAAYLAWDRTAPPFVKGNCLYIPSIFMTFNGESEDERLPLLRSQTALNKQELRLLKCLGFNDVQSMIMNVGVEQEFFLMEREAFLQRPDLMNCGRTVIGRPSPLNQQHSTMYFAKPDQRALAFFKSLQEELWALGITALVQHNEVAPSQHEWSPVFTITNIGADQNNIAMLTMKEVALKHGLVCLLHEKPFAGVNGSGKHNNWSMMTNTGMNVHVAGTTVEEQRSFTAHCAVLARAVKQHGDLIRIGVATAGNDHRLGAQEAPPAIMSLYIGKGMEEHLQKVKAGGPLEGYGAQQRTVPTGTNAVSDVPTNPEDRNRTAPIPWCGNRFEFRAVGSDQNIMWPLTLLHVAVADATRALADEIESGKSVDVAVREMLQDSMDAVFSGDGYSPDWPKEAARRGLETGLTNTPKALAALTSDKNTNLLTGPVGIFSTKEVVARQTVLAENYSELVLCEANTQIEMNNTGIVPACALDSAAFQPQVPARRATAYTAVNDTLEVLEDAVSKVPEDGAPLAVAHYIADVVRPAMDANRAAVDAAEGLVRKDLWPFPSYQTMLFAHHHTAA